MDGGFLATCSCSHFMTYELFTETIGQEARNVHKRLRQVEFRTQAPDHPILWAAHYHRSGGLHRRGRAFILR